MMKDLKITVDIFNSVWRLLDNYTDFGMPPVDYLQTIADKSLLQDEDYESALEIFLSIIHYRLFLTDVVNYFYCLGKRKKDSSDKNFLLIITYLITRALNNANKNSVIEILKLGTLEKSVNLLRFFNRRCIVEELFVAGCQYFEEDYVFENLITKVKENKDLLQCLLSHFEQLMEERLRATKRQVTVAVSPQLGGPQYHPSPPPPPNTPQEENKILAKPVPRSTYQEPRISRALSFEKEQNREASLSLLESANSATVSLLSVRSKQHVCSTAESPSPLPPHRHLKILKTDVSIKKNAATILREASRVIKEEEKEIKRVHELLSGAASYSKYEEQMEQVRQEEEQAKLEEIERKHLRGLLTREEAILAKQNLLEANKANRAQFDREREETEEILKQMRQKHNEKLKGMIEKIHQLQKNIVEKKREVIDERQKTAQEVINTSRKLQEKAMMRQREEMERRIEIIREIKAISNIKPLEMNKFDPTESMNLGLLCEMSLTELYERLLIKRASLKEEMERRKACITERRLKQRQFLTDTEQFIESCHQQKKEINSSTSNIQKLRKPIVYSQDIIDLREKLDIARKKRMEMRK